MTDKYEPLRLKNQLCFPIYAAAKEIIKQYQEPLHAIDLTYTQYIVMMVLWEHRSATVKELGDALYLDSGTLTPLLKKLEAKGYISRKRRAKDERIMDVTLTKKGEALQDQALAVPSYVSCRVDLTPEEASYLYKILYKMLDGFQ